MRLHVRRRAGSGEQEKPRATGSRRIADFDINLALSLCRALPVPILTGMYPLRTGIGAGPARGGTTAAFIVARRLFE